MARLKKVTISARRGVFVVEYRDDHGNRPRPSFKTREEAEEHKLLVEARAAGLISNEQRPITQKSIKSGIRAYLEVVKQKRVGATAKNESYYFDDLYVWLCNDRLRERIDQITTYDLEKFQSELRAGWNNKKPLASSTVNRMFQSFRPFFSKSVSWGWLASNPMAGLKALEEMAPQIQVWTTEQKQEAIRSLPLWARSPLFFLLETGRRPVDLSRATFGAINFEARTFSCKTFKGNRARELTIPLSDALFGHLKAIFEERKKTFRARATDPIFLTSRGTPVSAQNIGKALRRIGFCKKHSITLYGLRHTFINGLVDENAHPRDIQLLAGHAKFETTTRYTHRRVEHLRDTTNNVSEGKSLADWMAQEESETVTNRSQSSRTAT